MTGRGFGVGILRCHYHRQFLADVNAQSRPEAATHVCAVATKCLPAIFCTPKQARNWSATLRALHHARFSVSTDDLLPYIVQRTEHLA